MIYRSDLKCPKCKNPVYAYDGATSISGKCMKCDACGLYSYDYVLGFWEGYDAKIVDITSITSLHERLLGRAHGRYKPESLRRIDA